jgi:hypothetical protein
MRHRRGARLDERPRRPTITDQRKSTIDPGILNTWPTHRSQRKEGNESGDGESHLDVIIWYEMNVVLSVKSEQVEYEIRLWKRDEF